MSDYIRPRTATVLESSKDWVRWLPAISRAAGSYWPHWDPSNSHQPKPVEKPAMPAITRSRGQPSASGTQTRPQSAQAQQSAENGREIPDEDLYTYTERIERYKLLLPLYLAYDKQESAVRNAIMKSVSSSIQVQLDQLPRDLAGWLKFLHTIYGADEQQAQEDADKAHQAVLKKVRNTPLEQRLKKNWQDVAFEAARQAQEDADKAYQVVLEKVRNTPLEQWLKNWQDALFEAARLDVPRVASGKWLSDLANELAYLHLHTTGLAEGAYQNQATKPCDPNTAANWASRVLSEQKRREDIQGGRSVKGGAFATLDIEGEELSARKRGRDASDDDRWPKRKPREAQECEACKGIGHRLERCFGVFPERAPKEFRRGTLAHYVRIVDSLCDADPGLRRKVETARKAADA